MPLVTSKKMFEMAYENGYAIGAFNFCNMEITQGVVDAARKTDSPLILQIVKCFETYARMPFVKAMIQAVVEENPDVPICTHLDHGESFEECKEFVDAGFTSVMIDGSKYEFEDNIKLTRQVVEYAHDHGVVVEAELGRIGGSEGNIVGVSESEMKKNLTDPDQALEFVERTGVDSLAIACGTSHGAYKSKTQPKLAFDIIGNIAQKLPCFPLVMHGASSVPSQYKEMINTYGGYMPDAIGIPEEATSKACQMGICKVNIDTDLRMALIGTIREVFTKSPSEFDPRNYLGPGRDAIETIVTHKMKVLGCHGKAAECM